MAGHARDCDDKELLAAAVGCPQEEKKSRVVLQRIRSLLSESGRAVSKNFQVLGGGDSLCREVDGLVGRVCCKFRFSLLTSVVVWH